MRLRSGVQTNSSSLPTVEDGITINQLSASTIVSANGNTNSNNIANKVKVRVQTEDKDEVFLDTYHTTSSTTCIDTHHIASNNTNPICELNHKTNISTDTEDMSPRAQSAISGKSTITNGTTTSGSTDTNTNTNLMTTQQVDTTMHSSSTRSPELRPHNRCVVLLLQIIGFILVFMYFIVPAYLKFNPGIMTELAFLNRVTWPPFINMTTPSEFGLNSTRHFTLESTDSVTLGVWHSLPHGSHDSSTSRSDEDYEKMFGSGFPIIVYYHGNAGTRAAWHRIQLYKLLAKSGYHVVTFDYRGYADSLGKPSEHGLMEDALTVYNYVRKHSGDSPVYIWGHSMGSGVATKTAKYLCDHDMHPDAVILESPFTNLLEACVRHPFTAPFRIMPWFSWVFVEGLKQNNIYFHSDRSIGDVTVPMLILHAKDDGIVPYELGVKLYDIAVQTKAKGGVKFISFEAVHNYGHKFIHKAPDLPQIIKDFTTGAKK